MLRERRLNVHGSGKIYLVKRLKDSLLDTKTGEGKAYPEVTPSFFAEFLNEG